MDGLAPITTWIDAHAVEIIFVACAILGVILAYNIMGAKRRRNRMDLKPGPRPMRYDDPPY